MFKVDVHLGEHATPEEASATWPQEIAHLGQMGRESKAKMLQTKLDRMQEQTERS